MCHWSSRVAKQDRIKTHCLLKSLKWICSLLPLSLSWHQNSKDSLSYSLSLTSSSLPFALSLSEYHFPLFCSISFPSSAFHPMFWSPGSEACLSSLPLFVKIILLPNWARGWLSPRIKLVELPTSEQGAEILLSVPRLPNWYFLPSHEPIGFDCHPQQVFCWMLAASMAP